jgi:outer membrane cobalamin receptor
MAVWTTNDENRYQQAQIDPEYAARLYDEAVEMARRTRAAREQAEYDAMQPPEYCPHDNDLTYFTMDSGHRYLVCADCFEIIPDPEEEDSCATYS